MNWINYNFNISRYIYIYDARQNFGTVFGVHFPLKKVPQKVLKMIPFWFKKVLLRDLFLVIKWYLFSLKMKPHENVAGWESVVFSSTCVAQKRNYDQILAKHHFVKYLFTWYRNVTFSIPLWSKILENHMSQM